MNVTKHRRKKTAASSDDEQGSAARLASASVNGVLSVNSMSRHLARRQKRDGYFLKGPLSFRWIRQNIIDPADRVVLMARAFMDMTGAPECELDGKLWDCTGIADRYQRRRVLARIRQRCADYTVENRIGRPSVLRQARPGG